MASKQVPMTDRWDKDELWIKNKDGEIIAKINTNPKEEVEED